MNSNYLEFEQPIAELEVKIEELQLVGTDNDINISAEISNLRDKSTKLTEKIYANLSAWDIVQVARHPQRPYTLDYLPRIFTEFDELHGDRHFGDDNAIIGGIARLDGKPVMIIGQEKGRAVKDKVMRNFGMPKPEGYRKALRLMQMAERFKLPVITLIDTPGAYPGIDSEERGISESIAQNLAVMSALKGDEASFDYFSSKVDLTELSAMGKGQILFERGQALLALERPEGHEALEAALRYAEELKLGKLVFDIEAALELERPWQPLLDPDPVVLDTEGEEIRTQLEVLASVT